MPRETGGTGMDAEQSYEPICTGEGGEPQGSCSDASYRSSG